MDRLRFFMWKEMATGCLLIIGWILALHCKVKGPRSSTAIGTSHSIMPMEGKIPTASAFNRIREILQKRRLCNGLYSGGFLPSLIILNFYKMKVLAPVTFILVFLFYSCQKIVTLKLNTVPPQIVIQGEVTDSAGPYSITINQTADFYAPNVFPPVSGAVVKISDDLGASDSLIEYSPGIYSTQGLQARPGRTYTLSVFVQNKYYTSVSTMPMPVKLDSVTLELTSGFGMHRINAIVNFQDP